MIKWYVTSRYVFLQFEEISILFDISRDSLLILLCIHAPSGLYDILKFVDKGLHIHEDFQEIP